MIAPYAARAIAAQWQDATDQGLETGEPPVLDGGVAPACLDGAGSLLAMADLSIQRADATRPMLAAGGVTPWWLILLLRPPAVTVTAPKPDPQLAYTAPDPATHQAALTTWDRRQSPYRTQPAALPIALQTPFTPEDRPAAAAGMETQLFALSAAEQAPRDGWVAWVAVVVALILLLLAAIV
jgi:hypothetical protein